ncbi:MAG: hypothetical protein Q9184_001782 [Pyrenodesmia sp. 2 TL-2023]
MASDDAYSSFLDQANQETGADNVSAKSNTATTRAVNTGIPVGLQNVEQYYISEADEPFEPVSLKWDGRNMPTENEFAELIGHDSTVSMLDATEFDPRGQYKDVLQAVQKAGDCESRVYRVQHGKTRIEYYVIGLDKGNMRVIGLRAKAIES